MKINLIGKDNNRFEADLVRLFENVNDKYLIYTTNEKDESGFVTLYLTKVVSDNGIKVGEDVTDKNEWSLIKNFLKRTINENKENIPVTIKDIDPIEVNDLKINASKPFKLQFEMVELFSKNQKSFEIIQKIREESNTAIPVPTETTEYVTSRNIEELKPVSIESAQEVPTVSQNEESTINEVQESVSEKINQEPSKEESDDDATGETETYENLYNKMLEANKQLLDTNDKLIKENDELLDKLSKIQDILKKD